MKNRLDPSFGGNFVDSNASKEKPSTLSRLLTKFNNDELLTPEESKIIADAMKRHRDG